MNWKIPLSDIDFDFEEKNAANDVLQSKWLTMGSVTQEFEQAFANVYWHKICNCCDQWNCCTPPGLSGCWTGPR